jgi:fission process protein 1
LFFLPNSDIGEAFRPIVNRKLVSGAYGISIAYVVGDIGFEGYKAHLDRQERLLAGEKESCSASTEIGLRVARRTGGPFLHILVSL